MEYYTTELVLSVPAAIQLAKATANTLESPPRLYDGDVSSVHLWTDYWRFQVKPDKTVDFVGETGPNLPKNPALSLPKC